MDEAEDGAAVVLVEQAVVVAQLAEEGAHLLREAFGGFVVVVDVDFDVADAGAGELGERGEELGAVLLLRVEEAVAGALAVGVAGCGFGDRGPGVLPALDAGAGGGVVHPAAERLVVIGDGDPEAGRAGAAGDAAGAVAQVAGEPEFSVAGELHERCAPVEEAGRGIGDGCGRREVGVMRKMCLECNVV